MRSERLISNVGLAVASFVFATAGCESTVGQREDIAESTNAATSASLFVDTTRDLTGVAETASPSPIDRTSGNPFFRSMGTNGRFCGTCHVESLGWTMTPSFARLLPADDPLFLLDGSDCLPPGVPNPDPIHDSTQMLGYGTIRIDLPIPDGADYTLVSYTDPLGCPTPPSASDIRMYRRPLPSANSAFLATVMWDGRENVASSITDDLKHQSNDATLGHAQGTSAISDALQSELVAFETGTFFGQRNITGLDLASQGAQGGAEYLYTDVLPGFSIGINDPFQPGFTSKVFTIFSAWEPGSLHTTSGGTGAQPALDARRAAIGRGEALFNTKPISITDVPGLNGPNDASRAPIAGFCGTCHDTPNVGHHSVSLALDLGVTAPNAVGLDVAELPTYTFRETATGRTITVTDGGRGLITGKFADLGKTKGPILRGLAARAPYFHNGSAADLSTVVDFYDTRFSIGFSLQEKRDLVAFLSAL